MLTINRKAKIVCTIGPACESDENIGLLIEKGMDVARLNFSHLESYDHANEIIQRIRKNGERLKKAVAIMQDLQGPKIRTGEFEKGSALLEKGQEFTITTRDLLGNASIVSTTLKELPKYLYAGDKILLDDGFLELKVLETTKEDVRTEVIIGGVLRNHKGINLPGVSLGIDALTDKDIIDLKYGLKAGVDWIALSFVRSPEDLLKVKEVMQNERKVLPVISKIERPEAIARFDGILARTDGVMVARGDLGVEIPFQQVPTLQKMIVKKSNAKSKPVIVATEMLNSMIDHPKPTRAEVTDIANAIFDGADAVMLSGETAFGKYPLQAVDVMSKIIEEAEQHIPRRSDRDPPTIPAPFQEISAGIACRAARETGSKYIVCFTLTGTTARQLSAYRPTVPIIAFSPNEEIRRKLGLLWGVRAAVLDPEKDIDRLVEKVEKSLLALDLVQHGDKVIIVFGSPIGIQGHTNTVRMHQIEN